MYASFLLFLIAIVLSAPLQAQGGAPRIGPPRGSILLIGGGAEGAEVFRTFITLAGGPGALIVVVPTASDDSVVSEDDYTADDLRRAGARNVRVLHTRELDVANSQAFTRVIDDAHGLWISGGRQGLLLEAYKGTATEAAMHGLLARGGVIAGTSAGASVIGSLVVRGSPVTNRDVLVEGYMDGFGFLRQTAIDQHAVARDRLRDLPDSVLARHRELLGLAIDEGAALLVQGDSARVIGRSMGFVYGYGVWRDERVPYQTLRPGDSFDMNRRRPTRSARDATALTASYVDSLFGVSRGRSPRQAAVLVARNDEVLVANAYGITLSQKLAPRTSVPTFPLRGLSQLLHAVSVQLAVRDSTIALSDSVAARRTVRVDEFLESPGSFAAPVADEITRLISTRVEIGFDAFVRSRLLSPLGMRRTYVDTITGEFHSSVDELFRFEQAFRHGFPHVGSVIPLRQPGDTGRITGANVWRREKFRGSDMLSVAGRGNSFRSIYVRIPSLGMSVIVLSNDDAFNAREAALLLLQRATRAPMVIPP